MVAIKEWYQRVNEAWPAIVPFPPLTFDAGANAVRRLYRFVTGNTFTGKIVETTGRRYSYARRGTFFVNTTGHPHGRGAWHDFIHDLSHHLASRVYDYPIKPHSREHAKLELRLVKEIVKRGWLQPEAPQREPVTAPAPTRDLKAEKLLRIESRIVAWERKAKRAQTALRKLNRQRSYYQRVTGQTNATIH